MSKETLKNIITVPNTGDGNPATFWSIAHQCPELEPIMLQFSGFLARQIHVIMSTSSENSEIYTDNSPKIRTGLAAKAFSKLMFGELAFILKMKGYGNGADVIWNVVQEHALLAASERSLDKLGIKGVNLIVPDVYPKNSGEEAVANLKDRAKFIVWNQKASEYLTDLGFDSKLVSPFLLDYFWKNRDEQMDGCQVVVKSSGSDMPRVWRERLQAKLSHLGVHYQIHLPNGYFDFKNNFHKATSGKEIRLQKFYDALGDKTEVMISYPSEIVQVVADMHSRGLKKSFFLALPPRGHHELRNLQWAVETGLCPGVLKMNNNQESISGIPTIELTDIKTYLSRNNSQQNFGLGTRKIG